MSLHNLLNHLRQAPSWESAFDLPVGQPESAAANALKIRYRALAALTHPDRNPDCAGEAEEAFKLLQQWYACAQQQLQRGRDNAAPALTVTTRLHHYVSAGPPGQGALCDLYSAQVDGESFLLKVVRHGRNNDLLQAEAQALRQVARALVDQPVRAHFPTLVEAVQMRDANGAQRQINILRQEEGYVTLAAVVEKYPNGVAPADAAWMFNRLLAALGVTHRLGLIHGAVTLDHVLIRPADHNGLLLDWCYSVPVGAVLKAANPSYGHDYPPEVFAKAPVTAATDLFMAARCLVRLLGGDGSSDSLPPAVPKAMQALLRTCLLPAPHRRANDAWELFDDFQEILAQHYGARHFRPFVI
ncbi:MAG: DnaJ domain-containing protein [Caldilineaceae bacterium]